VQAAGTANLAVIQAEIASLSIDVNTRIDGLHRDVASLRWALGVTVAAFVAGLSLLYGKLADLSAGTAVRIVEVGQPVIDGTVTP